MGVASSVELLESIKAENEKLAQQKTALEVQIKQREKEITNKAQELESISEKTLEESQRLRLREEEFEKEYTAFMAEKDEIADVFVNREDIAIIRRKGYRLERGEGIRVQVSYSYVLQNGEVQNYSERHLVRGFFPKEVSRFLSNFHFITIGQYNNTSDNNDFEMSSNRIVTVAKKS